MNPLFPSSRERDAECPVWRAWRPVKPVSASFEEFGRVAVVVSPRARSVFAKFRSQSPGHKRPPSRRPAFTVYCYWCEFYLIFY